MNDKMDFYARAVIDRDATLRYGGECSCVRECTCARALVYANCRHRHRITTVPAVGCGCVAGDDRGVICASDGSRFVCTHPP